MIIHSAVWASDSSTGRRGRAGLSRKGNGTLPSNVMTAAETRRILDCRHVRGEMHEQPDVLARLSRHVEYFAEQVGTLAEGRGGFRDVVFLAPDRVQPVALLGRHALAVRCGLPSTPLNASVNANGADAGAGGASAEPSESTEPSAAPDSECATDSEPRDNPLDRRLVIALSPSGEDERVLELARRALDAGSAVAAVTNDARSPLASLATLAVDLAAGLEHSASATKSVTGMMLAVLALIDGLPAASVAGRFAADARGPRIANPACALAVAHAVGELLADCAPADVAATRLVPARRVAVVGQGHNHPAALETARMLRDTAGLLVEGFSVEEFSAGPMGGFDAETVVVLLAGRAQPAVRSLRARLLARAAQVVMFGELGDGGDLGGSGAESDELGQGPTPADLPLPALGTFGAPGASNTLGSAAECILATVRGQQLAIAAARALGVDPDRPAVPEAAAASPVRVHEHAGARAEAERGDGANAR